MNAILVDCFGNSRGFDSETVTLLLRPGWFFGVVRVVRKSYDYLGCGVSGFEAAGPIGFFYAFLRSANKARVAGVSCSGRVRLSTVLIRSPSLFGFSALERSGVLIERYGFYGWM